MLVSLLGLKKKEMKGPAAVGFSIRGDSGNFIMLAIIQQLLFYATHLSNPFLSKLLRLLALHSESRNSKNSIALVESLSPLDGGVDNLRINTSNRRQKTCDV